MEQILFLSGREALGFPVLFLSSGCRMFVLLIPNSIIQFYSVIFYNFLLVLGEKHAKINME